LSDLPSGLLRFLKPGMILKGKVLKIFPNEGKAVVQLNNQKLVVESAEKLTPGRPLRVRVEQVSPHPVLKLITTGKPTSPQVLQAHQSSATSPRQAPETVTRLSSEPSPVPQELTSRDLKILNLSPGQTVRAEVVKIAGESTAFVRIAGKEVAVHFTEVSPPKPGAVVEAVLKPHEGFFRLVAGEESISRQPIDLGKIKALLPQKQPFGDMVQKLEALVSTPSLLKTLRAESSPIERLIQTLEILRPQSGQIPNGARVKEQVNLSGINYEPKVKQVLEGKKSAQNLSELGRDLKGQLLELAKALEVRADAKDVSPVQRRQIMELAQTFRRAGDNIELQQLTNQLARQENQPIVLQIPNPFALGEKTIKLYVRHATDEEEGGKKDKGKGVFLVFLLNMSALGDLRIDARVSQNRISIKINVENEAVAQFIDRNLEEFRLRMTEIGFQAEVACCLQEKVDPEIENDLNRLLVDEDSRLVDLTT
ncbi:MAG: flagellar hook-length control protein FliK, partial [Nitrospinae bacterium]|nr:flagellar hook-length control protein FliK [Nitrospinota bacterium]